MTNQERTDNDSLKFMDGISFKDDYMTRTNEIEPHYQRTSEIQYHNIGDLLQSFSVKVLDWNDNFVKTEFLINKEEGKYQVRSFPIEVFEGKHYLEHGYLLKALLYVNSGQMTIKFIDGKQLVKEDDFPNDNPFEGLDSKIFKFK